MVGECQGTPMLTRFDHREEGVYAPLELYLRQIGETPLLSADEERSLAFRNLSGDLQARERIIRANLRLVVSIAQHFNGRGLSLQDLIEEGNLGLLQAVKRFDPARNTRFSTYASYWIKQSIRLALINTVKTIRIPSHMVELLRKWRAATAQLEKQLEREPTPEEVGELLQFSKKRLNLIRRALRLRNAAVILDEASTGLALEELIMDANPPHPESDSNQNDDVARVLSLLEQMNERQATILRLRFGLSSEGPLTLKEIGQRFGLTSERVRQIERQALRKLGQRMGPR
jgi:RNA polymerase primary sigma factor